MDLALASYVSKSDVLLSKYARHVSDGFYSADNPRSNDLVAASPIEHVPSTESASNASECGIVVEKPTFEIEYMFDPFKTIHIQAQ